VEDEKYDIKKSKKYEKAFEKKKLENKKNLYLFCPPKRICLENCMVKNRFVLFKICPINRFVG